MRPILSWYGGKQRLVSKIIPYIPAHKIYVEPFSGGASLFFAKPEFMPSNQNLYREILNDNDNELINFYMTAKQQPDDLVESITNIPYAEEIYKFYKTRKSSFPTNLENAVSFYVRIMFSFSRKKDQGFAYSKRVTNHPHLHQKKIKQLFSQVERLSNVTIHCRDALKIIDMYDTENTFFYCDPPYPNTDCRTYDAYSQEQFVNLVKKLQNIKGKFMLSCYPNDAPPLTCVKKEFKTINSSQNTNKTGKREPRNECIWMNYSIEKEKTFQDMSPHQLRLF